jgi:hypothetical protein
MNGATCNPMAVVGESRQTASELLPMVYEELRRLAVTGRPDQAADWKQRLEELEQAQTIETESSSNNSHPKAPDPDRVK